MSDVDLIINVHTNGIKDVANLSASVKALTANLREITIPMTKLDVQSRAVNKALGLTNHGMREHAKTIKELKENQRALGEESKRLKSNIIAYTGAIRSAGGPTTALGRELTSTKANLQAMSASMRGARVRAFGSDVASVSLKMQKMGKDAQFVGRSLMINLTAPIMLFGRLGFQSLLAVDKESTRLSKVFDSVAMSAEQAAMKVGVIEGKMPTAAQATMMKQMVSAFKALDSQLTGVSSRFGVSKDIVVGLASDFAELGIVQQENIVLLTTLTTSIEKLGGMDIGAAKDLSQALFFNAKRAYEANGAFRIVTDARERETMAIRAAQTQLSMFNAIENVTALTLQDLADALPEVGSMATAFGLSMVEAAAMLAPMKAAGLDVGASATSIKTSLQRLILPTIKNTKFMAELAAQYGVNTEATNAFNSTTKTGLVGLQAIVDVFSQIKDSSAGTEGALKLMSQLFEKRQGPRMFIAIEQLALFDKQLKTTGSAENSLANIAEEAIVKFNSFNNTTLKATIENFRDIGILARVAAGTAGATVDGYKGKGVGGALATTDIESAKAARAAVAAQVRKDRAEGVDTFAGVASEAGRAMLIELAGPITATEIANNELDISLKSLSVSVQKIKNNFKLFAAEILRAVAPAIKFLSAKLEQFQEYWAGLTQSTRDSIARVVAGVLLFLAVLGPIVITIGTFQASVGVLGGFFAKFLPQIRNAEGGLVAFGSSADLSRQKIDKFYQSLRNVATQRIGGRSQMSLVAAGITKATIPEAGGLSAAAAARQKFALGRSAIERPPSLRSALSNLEPVRQLTPPPQISFNSVTSQLIDDERRKVAKQLGFYNNTIEDAIAAMRDKSKVASLSPSAKRVYDLSLQKAVPQVGVPAGPLESQGLRKKVFAEMKANQAILFAQQQADEVALHAQKMADIQMENAAQMKSYKQSVAATKLKTSKADYLQGIETAKKRTAMAARQESYEKAGITTSYKQTITDTATKIKGTSTKGADSFAQAGKVSLQRSYKGMDISQETANRIGRGGIRSKLTRFGLSGKSALDKVESGSGGLTPTKFARGMFPGADVAGPIRGGGIKQGLKNVGRLMLPANGKLVSDQGADNVRGLFNTGRGAVKNTFTKSMQGGKQAVSDLVKANADAGFGKEAGNIKNATVAMKGFMSATKGGTIALKLMKLALISSGIGVAIAVIGIAVLVIVKNFDQFKKSGAGAFASLKAAFSIFKDALKEVARPFLDLFAMFGKGGKEGKSAVGGLAAAFGLIAKAVKFVAGLFKKFVMNVIQPYLYMIINIVMFVVSIFTGKWGDAFGYLTAAVSQVAKFVVQAFALLVKGMISLIALGIKLVIGYFTLIPKAVAKSFSWLSKLPGMGFLSSVGNGIDNVIDGLYGLVDAGKGAAMGAVDSVAGAVTNFLDKGVNKGLKKSKGAIKIFGGDTKADAEAAGEAIADNMGDGFAKGDIGGAMKKEIEDVLQTLQDYVAGELKNAVDKYVAQAEDALKKQKDAALKVFDVQITTLDKLEKAQESLTRTMAYESEKRKRIDDKALTDEQFRRNYALAIYEGRVDDARMLQLQQGADEKSYSEDIKAIETKRGEELAKENLDALKTAIAEAKDAAGKFFDESLIKFQEAAALVTKFPPVTIQDYQDQVNKLHTITMDASIANSTEFGKMFEAFATTIADKMPNKVIGAFSTNLDDLVVEAQRKYGLGGNPEENSIIGATLGMLADMGGTFGDKKQTVIDAFGLVSTGLVSNFDVARTEILRIVDEDFLTPFAEASLKFVTNWETVYKQAIIDGNISITDSLRNNVKINKALFDELKDKLTETTLKWLGLKVAADAAAAAQEAAAGGGGATAPTASTNPATQGGRIDAFENNNASRVARGLKPLTYQEFAFGTGYVKSPVIKRPTGPFAVQRAKGGMIPSGFINAPTQEGVPALLHGGEYIINAKAVSRLGIGALEKLNNNLMPKFAKGGYVPSSPSMSFSAALQGGEYAINASAVKNMGVRTMQSINQSRFRAPSGAPSYSGGGGSTSVSTVNINVDTFVGEEEWFKSMMKSYNVNVLPKMNKAAGNESRTFTSYNGIN